MASTLEHDQDFVKWSNDQADHLRKKEFEKLDMDNLIEEIESLGRSEKRALKGYLKNLLLHLLKIKFQPNMSSRSWTLSIVNSRRNALDVLSENPSLKHSLNDTIEKAYKTARLEAVIETGLDEEIFPYECPWSNEEILEE